MQQTRDEKVHKEVAEQRKLVIQEKIFNQRFFFFLQKLDNLVTAMSKDIRVY